MEGPDAEAELVRERHHAEHLVGAIAVHLHQHPALDDTPERLEPEVSGRR